MKTENDLIDMQAFGEKLRGLEVGQWFIFNDPFRGVPLDDQKERKSIYDKLSLCMSSAKLIYLDWVFDSYFTPEGDYVVRRVG